MKFPEFVESCTPGRMRHKLSGEIQRLRNAFCWCCLQQPVCIMGRLFIFENDDEVRNKRRSLCKKIRSYCSSAVISTVFIFPQPRCVRYFLVFTWNVCKGEIYIEAISWKCVEPRRTPSLFLSATNLHRVAQGLLCGGSHTETYYSRVQAVFKD